MRYLEARSDVKFLTAFRADVLALWEKEEDASRKLRGRSAGWLGHHEYQKSVQAASNAAFGAEYAQLRTRVAKGTQRAARLAVKLRVPIIMTEYPAPAVGGVPVKVDAISAILTDPTFNGVGKQFILDTLDKILGEAEARVQQELMRLVNPLNWISDLVRMVVRLPFTTLELSGFSVSKIEDHLLAKVFKVVEILVIVYFLARWKLPPDKLATIVGTLFGN